MMSYVEPFNGMVTTTKRNHRYYGPTESDKMNSNLTEISADLATVFLEITNLSDSIDALASGYLSPSGVANSLADIRIELNNLQGKILNTIYLETNKPSTLV
jgi:hypothetical protein